MTESETDGEFLNRLHGIEVSLDRLPAREVLRLFALARRGAAVRWRPISEESPELDNILLCGVDWTCEGWRSKDRWYEVNGDRIEGVTHWMPLPPPPALGEPE